MFLTVLSIAVVSFAQSLPEYVATPSGYILSKCAHTVPSGTYLKHDTLQGGMIAHHESFSEPRYISKCQPPKGYPMRASREEMAVMGSKNLTLPANYDGWTVYTVFESSNNKTFDSFVNNFSTPTDLPKETPQQLFIFPGLQNQDWIPAHDKEPFFGFDIIQPVLQYPSSRGDGWSVKSWYVTTDIGTVATEEIALTPGDVILGNMTMTGPNTWYVDSVVKGKHTHVTVDHPRLKTQPWAYNTVECYGCRGCGTYPTTPTFFTDIVITQQNKQVPVSWLNTPKKPGSFD